MYNFLVTKTTAVLAPRLGCEPGSKTHDKLQYGVYIFYINAIKTVVLVIIALILRIFPYVVVFALAYGALRSYSFGVHLESTLLCTLMGMVYYLGSTYLCLYIGIPLAVKAALLTACAMCFAEYAPAQTIKRPIPGRQRKPLKTKALAVLTVLIIAIFILHPYSPVYSDLLCMAAVCQTVNLLPVTYIIYRES